jgi:hypothetical protein
MVDSEQHVVDEERAQIGELQANIKGLLTGTASASKPGSPRPVLQWNL